MGFLVVYCLKGVDPLAVGLTAAIHCWKRSSLLSIGIGTAFYMVLVQMVF